MRYRPLRNQLLRTTLTIGNGCHLVDVELAYTYFPEFTDVPEGCPPEPAEVIFHSCRALQLDSVEPFDRAGREDWFADLDRIGMEAVNDACWTDGMQSAVARAALAAVCQAAA